MMLNKFYHLKYSDLEYKSQKFTLNCPAGHMAQRILLFSRKVILTEIIWRWKVQSHVQKNNKQYLLKLYTCTR